MKKVTARLFPLISEKFCVHSKNTMKIKGIFYNPIHIDQFDIEGRMASRIIVSKESIFLSFFCKKNENKTIYMQLCCSVHTSFHLNSLKTRFFVRFLAKIVSELFWAVFVFIKRRQKSKLHILHFASLVFNV